MKKLGLLLIISLVLFSCQSSQDKLEEAACRIAQTVNKNPSLNIAAYESGISMVIFGTPGLKEDLEKTYKKPISVNSHLNSFYLEKCISIAEKNCPEEGKKIRELYVEYNERKHSR